MVQNTAKINKKNVYKYLSYNTTNVSKNYFIFNKLTKLINVIIFRIMLFYNEPCNKV